MKFIYSVKVARVIKWITSLQVNILEWIFFVLQLINNYKNES